MKKPAIAPSLMCMDLLQFEHQISFLMTKLPVSMLILWTVTLCLTLRCHRTLSVS